jgi:hypothetical protein
MQSDVYHHLNADVNWTNGELIIGIIGHAFQSCEGYYDRARE